MPASRAIGKLLEDNSCPKVAYIFGSYGARYVEKGLWGEVLKNLPKFEQAMIRRTAHRKNVFKETRVHGQSSQIFRLSM